jgi:hypothetical protein
MQNLSCVRRNLGISKIISLIEFLKGAFSDKFEKDIQF